MPLKEIPSKLAAYTASIVRGLIDQESELVISQTEGRCFDPDVQREVDGTLLHVQVVSADVGKVVGREGQMSHAIRRLIYAFAKKHRLGRVVFQVSEIPGSRERTHVHRW